MVERLHGEEPGGRPRRRGAQACTVSALLPVEVSTPSYTSPLAPRPRKAPSRKRPTSCSIVPAAAGGGGRRCGSWDEGPRCSGGAARQRCGEAAAKAGGLQGRATLHNSRAEGAGAPASFGRRVWMPPGEMERNGHRHCTASKPEDTCRRPPVSPPCDPLVPAPCHASLILPTADMSGLYRGVSTQK